METEICRRTFTTSTNRYLMWSIISLLWAVFSVVVNFIVRGALAASYGGYYVDMSYGPFWAGWGNMILGLLLFVIFLFCFLLKSKREIILTNKRLIISAEKNTLFRGVIRIEKSYILNKMVSIDLVHFKKNGSTCFGIRFSGDSLTNLNVDHEFYNELIKLI